ASLGSALMFDPSALAVAEHRRVGLRAGVVPRDRRTVDDADADLAELAREHHVAVLGAVHPPANHRARGPGPADAPLEVLAEPPGSSTRQVAGVRRAGFQRAVPAVGEEVPRDHRVAVALRRDPEVDVRADVVEMVAPALLVDQAGDREAGVVR